MITFLLPYALKMVAARWAKPMAWLIAVIGAALALLALWGLLALLVHRHDDHVVDAYENGVRARVQDQVNVGASAADAQENITAARDEERHNQVQEAIDNAVSSHPEEARRPVGRVSQSALDRLRHR